MVRSVVGKVMWMARATTTVVGLAIMLVLLFGIASMALGADDRPFILGEKNTASKVSQLVKSEAGPALNLRAGSGPPLAVNSTRKVRTLNADTLDGEEVIDEVGPLPVDGTFTSEGGTLIVSVSGSGYRGTGSSTLEA